MKKKTKFIQNFATIILAISIPGLLALASFETKRYATLEKEVSDLEKKQYELIEENKKLVSEIGMLSSSERIEKIAVSGRVLQTIDIDSDKPFVLVMPEGCNFSFYDVNKREIEYNKHF